MSVLADQLAFEKTTIRTLTNDEIDDVSGGITPALYAAAASSEPCATVVATIIIIVAG